ncbi:hypothetical protein, partial [Methanothrix soehngenii]|uniref:hypothetical protein n=1 Tax=Methanothrix soehngenii TaxID=2223 RepID=UPI002FDB82EA
MSTIVTTPALYYSQEPDCWINIIIRGPEIRSVEALVISFLSVLIWLSARTPWTALIPRRHDYQKKRRCKIRVLFSALSVSYT